MRRVVSLTAILAWLLSVPLSLARAEPTLQQRYLDIYLKINDAEHLEAKRDYQGSLEEFKDCYTQMEKIHESDPNWETALVIHRLDDFKAKILDLGDKAAAPTGNATTRTAGASSPTKATGLTDNVAFTTFTKKAQISYPWKTNIITTLFWIGEGSTTASAWNEKWTQSNNGGDSPQDRNGYASGQHASSLNPFYVALPFNDLAFPDKARQWLPPGWQLPHKDGKQASACKDRWVEIKNRQGECCYAQWEDVGPLRNDHAEYVFGSEQPGPGAQAGLCLSPAVAQYLRLDDTKTVASWRFVDGEDVPPGQWLKLDEQAVIYTALHQQKNSSAPSGPDVK